MLTKLFRMPLLLAIPVLMLHSCSDHGNPMPSEYLVFGHFYGFCLGDQCIQMYKIDQEQLFEDTLKKYPQNDSFYQGAFRELNPSSFQEAKGLPALFPEALLNEPDTVFGCPDCADAGGLYIEFKSGDTHRFWLIDQVQGHVPAYLHPFMEEVNKTIEKINLTKGN